MPAPPLKKNDVIEIEIDDLGYDGEGIAHVGSYAVFIRYALPKERVRALVIAVKSTFAVAKLQSVLTPSSERREPFCPVYYKCGGCSLQHASYEFQLQFKRKAIADTFYKTAKLEVMPNEVIASPMTRAYRNKMSVPVRGENAELGFFAVGSHRVVPIDECPIQFEGNGELITAFREYLREKGISGYNETTRTGTVKHLAVRKLKDIITVTAVINGHSAKEVKTFDDVLKKLYGDKYKYFANFNKTDGNRILGSESVLIGGSASFVELDGLRVDVHPQSFFQVNDGIREMLYREVMAEIDTESVVDAYSGAGLLSALLARAGHKVDAVEIEPKAVESAENMLKVNRIENVKTHLGDCARVLPELTANKKDFTLILDPPRAGSDKAVLSAAALSHPRKIVYVSCNPATLARDSRELLSLGYEITRLQPFDMFPHSGNVETLAVFSHKKPDGHINVNIEFGEEEG